MSSNLHRTRSKGYMPSIIFKTILVDRSGSMSSFQGKQYDMVEHLLEDSKKQALEERTRAAFAIAQKEKERPTLLLTPSGRQKPLLDSADALTDLGAIVRGEHHQVTAAFTSAHHHALIFVIQTSMDG